VSSRSLLVVLALLVPARARGDDDATARAKAFYDEANKHYDLREYKEAIDGFKKAFDLLPDAEFLFDIAQAYRQIRDCENASAFYRTYLRERPNADNRGKVEKFIVEMDDCAKQDEAIREEERQRKLREQVKIAPAQQPPRRDHTLRDASLVTLGVGIVAMGFAAYFSIDGANQQGTIQAMCKLGCEAVQVAGFDQTGKSDNTNAAISYVVGGVALAAGGGILLWTTLHRDDHITVAPAPGGAAVSARWSF